MVLTLCRKWCSDGVSSSETGVRVCWMMRDPTRQQQRSTIVPPSVRTQDTGVYQQGFFHLVGTIIKNSRLMARSAHIGVYAVHAVSCRWRTRETYFPTIIRNSVIQWTKRTSKSAVYDKWNVWSDYAQTSHMEIQMSMNTENVTLSWLCGKNRKWATCFGLYCPYD
jgi:hypothetical protein